MTQNSNEETFQIPFYLRLSGRLLLALVFIAVLSVVVLGLAAYSAERAALESQVTKQLISVADMKEQQIETWLEERRADARLLAVNQLNQDHLTQLLSAETPRSRKEEFTTFMNDNLLGFQQARAGYTEVALVDTGGTIIFASDPQLVGEVTSHEEVLTQTLAAPDGEYIQDLHRDPNSGQIVMAFGHTMHAMDLDSGEVLPTINGATLIVVDMAQTIYPLIETFPGLGQTGETLLVRTDGRNTLFLNNIRFEPDSALNLHIPSDSPNAIPAHNAARGQEGSLRSLDYRGESVLAVSRHIEGIDWGFVTKQDLDEAFAPINELARRIGLVMVAIVLGAGVASAVLSRTLTRPLATLVEATRKIAAGDLSPEIGVGRRDEIGALANAFRVMVNALNRRQRQEEIVSTILRELNATSDVTDAFPTVATELRSICQCQSLSLGLLDEAYEQVTIIAQDGPRPLVSQGMRLRLRESVVADSVREGRVHATPDLEGERELPIDRMLYEAGFRSRVILPLTVEERVIGLLNLGWLAPGGYDPFILRLLNQVGGAIALAIERSRLFTETHRRAEELETLAALSSTLRAAPTLAEMLPAIMEKVTLALNGLSSRLYLLEPDSNRPVVHGTYPQDSEFDDERSWTGEGIVNHVMTTGEIHISENWGSSEKAPPAEAGPFDVHHQDKARGHIFLPLRSEDHIVGVLQTTIAERGNLTDAKLRLISAMADIAGNGVHRARVLQTLEQRVATRTQELAEANERLKELDFLKSKFVSEVSHELRTPVTNLKLYVELLDKGSVEKQDRIIAVLRQQIDRLAQLVTDILDLSRLELGRERISFEPVDVNAVGQQIVTAHVPRAEAAELSLTFEPEPRLPPVEGERNQLAQVITNLVANAINYTPQGMIEVRTFIDEERECVGLEVRDTGIGIAPDDLPHLFERFYRGQLSSELDVPGTGLGLGIVQEIVELHQGSIEVESEIGEGTTFRIYLPAAQPERTTAAT